ncbi:MAG: glycosyltransferase [Verrucomicrobia bacterium]|nr:glycosyltransferase [Verrucomicrobiota bacterium]
MDRQFTILTTYKSSELKGPALETFPHLRFVHRPVSESAGELVRVAASAMFGRNYDAVLVEGAREVLVMSLFKLATLNRKTRLFGNLMYFQVPPQNPLKRALYFLKRSIIAIGADRLVVLSSDEIDSYNRILGFPRRKLVFLLYKINDQEYLRSLTPTQGDYIYAGGDSIRDYKTLFEAVRGLDIKVKALTHLRFQPESIPANVEVIENTNTPAEYYSPCAQAMFVVLPIQPGFIRSSAQGTFLGSMFLRKAVVVSDTPGVRDIIRDGENGFVVPAGDAQALRTCIMKLAEDPALCRAVGDTAHNEVKHYYTLQRYLSDLFGVMQERLTANRR